MTRMQAVRLILDELESAEKIHPTWPADRVYQAGIVCEEAGESMKEALNLRPEDPHFAEASIAKFKHELKQTGAMAVRALMSIDEEPTT